MAYTHDRLYYHRPSSETLVGVFAKYNVLINSEAIIEEKVAFEFEHEQPSPILIVQKFPSLPERQKLTYPRLPSLGHSGCSNKELDGLRELLSLTKAWQTYDEKEKDEFMPKNRLQLYVKILRRTNPNDSNGKPVIEHLTPSVNAPHVAIFYRSYFEMGHESRKGLFLDAGRLAHSCMPNCYASWNPEDNYLRVCPLRYIPMDEELTICYNGTVILLEGRDERNRILDEKYGYKCTCPACDLTTEVGMRSESNRAAIREGMSQLGSNLDRASMVQLHIKLFKLMEIEGLVFYGKAVLHSNLASLYENGGDYDMAEREAANAANTARLCMGKHPDADNLREEFVRVKAAARRRRDETPIEI